MSADNANGTSEASWAVVELMGHRMRIGRVSEAEMFGGKMLRIDIPVAVGTAQEEFITEFYGRSSIYAYRPMTEELARDRAAEYGDPRPPSPMDFRLEHRLILREIEAAVTLARRSTATSDQRKM